jgi:hypothetical protein
VIISPLPAQALHPQNTDALALRFGQHFVLEAAE